MVKKVDKKEIMTSRQAKEQYREFHIGFVTTEQNMTDPDNEKGYVVCIMDSYDEGYNIPRRTDNGDFISIMSGYAVGGTEIGALLYGGVYHDQ